MGYRYRGWMDSGRTGNYWDLEENVHIPYSQLTEIRDVLPGNLSRGVLFWDLLDGSSFSTLDLASGTSKSQKRDQTEKENAKNVGLLQNF